MTDALLSGLLAGYGVAVPVGAIAVLIMGLAARTSLPVGAGAGLGVATADGLYALLAVAGGAAVAGLIRPIAAPLRWTALIVLIGLAARTAWSAWRAHRADASAAAPERSRLSARRAQALAGKPERNRLLASRARAEPATPEPGGADVARGGSRHGRPAGRLALSSPGRAYAGLLGLTLLNPTTIVYFSALVLGHQAGAGRSLTAGALFVVAAFAASASWQLLVAAGGSLLGRVLSGARGRLATALVSSAVMVVLAVRLALAS